MSRCICWNCRTGIHWWSLPRCCAGQCGTRARRTDMAIITSIDCVLPRPDIGTLAQNLKTELSQRLLGGAPVLPMSAEDVLSYVMAGTINLMHGFVTQALKENDPATMCCDNLITYGAQ